MNENMNENMKENMKKKVLFIVSSITGNAYKLARPMEDTLREEGFFVEEMTANEFLKAADMEKSKNRDKSEVYRKNSDSPSAMICVNENDCSREIELKHSQKQSIIINNYQKITEELPSADLYVVCFWCRRGSLDDLSGKVVSKLYSKNTILVGTMGASPEREYGKKVPLTIRDFASKYTNLKGIYVCQGKIDEKRTEKRRKLPMTDPHYLDDAGYARHLKSRSHPDNVDILNACTFIKNTSCI